LACAAKSIKEWEFLDPVAAPGWPVRGRGRVPEI
jgi:hypothetical protein